MTRQMVRAGLIVATLTFVVVGCTGGEEDEDEPLTITTDADREDAVDTSDGGVDESDAAEPCDEGEMWDPEAEACLCGGTVCGDGASCNAERGVCEVDVEAKCVDSAAPWSSGVEAFRETSQEWGLTDIDATGVRLSVTDLEGDGWPDLVVRKVGNTPNTFGDGGERTVWVLRNTGDGSFEDVTRQSELLTQRSGDESDGGRPAEVVVWGDVDNDGDLDAYTGFNRSETVGEKGDTAEIMLNQGDGTFELGPRDNDIRRPGEIDRPAGASFVDFDRDGHLDLWVTEYSSSGRHALQDRLYRGRGDGSFEEVTDERGLGTAAWGSRPAVWATHLDELNAAEGHSRAWGANACDLTGDGVPELLANSYGRAPNHLWHGRETDRGVQFANESVDSGYAYDDGMDWTDNLRARCYCDKNPEAEECGEVPEPSGIDCDQAAARWFHEVNREPFRLGGNSGTTVCADLDRDGRLDLLTHEIVHWYVGSSSDPSEILYNRTDDGPPTFERPGGEATGLTRSHDLTAWNEGDITGGVFDFDNDARPDIYIGSTDYPGTRGVLYHQTGEGSFEQVPITDGIDQKSSHGLAVADFDRDGDVDVVAGHSRNRCNARGADHCYEPDDTHVRMFENQLADRGNWLQIDLVGREGSNRAAIGAQVEVETDGGTELQEVDGGHGHYGMQHDTTLHFGLGDRCEAAVQVRWPDASSSRQTYLFKAGHRYRWRQGEAPEVADLDSSRN